MEHLIWSNFYTDIYLEDWKDIFEEDDITDEDEQYDMIYDYLNSYLDDERIEFKSIDKKNHFNPIVVLASVGRWTGQCTGYKFVSNLEDTLYDDCDECKWYVDDEDFKFSGSHHDGHNSYVYRELKDGVDKDEWEDKFLDLDDDEQKDFIEETTQSLKPYFDDYYGW